MSLTTDFKARFPAFATADVDTYMPIIEPVWSSYYNKDYAVNKEAALNLIAHLLVLEINAGNASVQNEQSKSVGSVSVSYAQSTRTGALTDFLSSTKYGQRFLLLTAHQFGGVAV
ncbi:MAG: DUF4054 domain-containing protein [Mariprofundaceae bacterium]|nr:DUF4054 domain-containing protein [Methylophaga sp.]MBL4759639.1 DUF4054 domain-containing protein [Mariprofundaceae bacterium]